MRGLLRRGVRGNGFLLDFNSSGFGGRIIRRRLFDTLFNNRFGGGLLQRRFLWRRRFHFFRGLLLEYRRLSLGSGRFQGFLFEHRRFGFRFGFAYGFLLRFASLPLRFEAEQVIQAGQLRVVRRGQVLRLLFRRQVEGTGFFNVYHRFRFHRLLFHRREMHLFGSFFCSILFRGGLFGYLLHRFLFDHFFRTRLLRARIFHRGNELFGSERLFCLGFRGRFRRDGILLLLFPHQFLLGVRHLRFRHLFGGGVVLLLYQLLLRVCRGLRFGRAVRLRYGAGRRGTRAVIFDEPHTGPEQVVHRLLIAAAPLLHHARAHIVDNEVADHEAENLVAVLKKGHAKLCTAGVFIGLENARRVGKRLPDIVPILLLRNLDTGNELVHAFVGPALRRRTALGLAHLPLKPAQRGQQMLGRVAREKSLFLFRRHH